jgi:parallel beta-helix repeat protein
MRNPLATLLLVIVLMGVAVGCQPRTVVRTVEVVVTPQVGVVEVTATPVPTDTPPPPTATPAPVTVTVCATGCDFTTIQAAIDHDGTGAGSTINVTDAVHTEAGIVVNKDVVIQGQGANSTIVQAHEVAGEAADRVFSIVEGATVVIRDMTIRHGKPNADPESGGGIHNEGTLAIKDCVVRDNVAKDGGGITNKGVLTAINCAIRNNESNGDGLPGQGCGSGGGIRDLGARMELVNCTISDNTASTSAGGIHVACAATAVLTNCTVSGNSAATGAGGGIRVKGKLQLVNCTISDNTAYPNYGAGVSVGGTLSYTNTIIAGNNTGGDCVIVYSDGGKQIGTIGASISNLVGNGKCDAAYSGDPMLDVLADNGGDIQTHALLPGSPAIDAIPADECIVGTDQRGEPRPQGAGCDIGAYELQ